MRLFVGFEVSLLKTSICVTSEYDEIIKEAQAESEPEVLAQWLNDLEGCIAAIGLEAGPLSQWLHRGLNEAGLDTVLMETRQVKGALKAMPIKTDRRDAEGIARLLHLGWFRPVHCKSVSAQETRAVLGAWKAIQQNMIALEMSLRGLLRNFGLKVGAISRGRFEARIQELAEAGTGTRNIKETSTADHLLCTKPLDWHAPATEVLSLLYLGFAMLSPSATLAEAADGAVFGV